MTTLIDSLKRNVFSKSAPILILYVTIVVSVLRGGCKFVVLRFYGPDNPTGSCRAQSVFLTTLILGRICNLSS